MAPQNTLFGTLGLIGVGDHYLHSANIRMRLLLFGSQTCLVVRRLVGWENRLLLALIRLVRRNLGVFFLNDALLEGLFPLLSALVLLLKRLDAFLDCG